MINEAELEHRLHAIGFEIVHPQQLSADDQAALMRDAKFVVAAAGSANVNIAFATASTTFIEIFAGDYFDHVFYRLAMMRSVNYIFYREPSLFHDISLRACTQHRPGTQHFSYELNLDRFMSFLQERLKGVDVLLPPFDGFNPSAPSDTFAHEISFATDGLVHSTMGWSGSKEQFVSEVLDPVATGFKGIRLSLDPRISRSEIICACNWAIMSFGGQLLEIDLRLPKPSDSSYPEDASAILGVAIDITIISRWPSTLFFDYSQEHFVVALVRNSSPIEIGCVEIGEIFRRVTNIPSYSMLKDLVRVCENPLKEVRQMMLESARLAAECDQYARRYRTQLDIKALWLYQMLYIDEAETCSRIPLLSSSILSWRDDDAKLVDVFADTETALVHPKCANEPATRLILRYQGAIEAAWFGCAAQVSHDSSKPVYFQARILCGLSGQLRGVCEVTLKGGELGYMAVQLPKGSSPLTICLFTTMLNRHDSNEFAWAQFVAPSLFNRA